MKNDKQILILGNGFDLAHFLPTAYIHFMEAMISLQENKSGAMGFDKFFKKRLKNNDDKFFKKTKELYKTEQIELSADQVTELQKKLNENAWFGYFQNHLNDIDTWIDFESEIAFVLNALYKIFTSEIKPGNKYFSNFLEEIEEKEKKWHMALFIDLQIVEREKSYLILPAKYLKKHGEIIMGFDDSKILEELGKELDEFTAIFSYYLKTVIHELKEKKTFSALKGLENIGEVFTFNYTDSFKRFYSNHCKNIKHLLWLMRKREHCVGY